MTDLRYVVYIVGAALLLCVAGIIAIAGFTDRTIPDVLQNIAVGCLTGLVGLLVPSSVSRHRGEGGWVAPTLTPARGPSRDRTLPGKTRIRARRLARRGDVGESELAVLLGLGGIGLIVLDVFVAAGGLALTVIGVLMILGAVALALLRR